jgi:hypothetical protein
MPGKLEFPENLLANLMGSGVPIAGETIKTIAA